MQIAGLAVALFGDGVWKDQADGALCVAPRTTISASRISQALAVRTDAEQRALLD